MAAHTWTRILDDEWDAAETEVVRLVENVPYLRAYHNRRGHLNFELEMGDEWVGRISIHWRCTTCGAYDLDDDGGDFGAIVGGSNECGGTEIL